MDNFTIRRICESLLDYLDTFLERKKNRPDDLMEQHNAKVSIMTIVGFAESEEKAFLEWLTKGSEDSYGYLDYGIYRGSAYTTTYPRYQAHLRVALESSDTTFNYILSEYHNIMKAKEFLEYRLSDMEWRTCEICETRFETSEGMHRHRAKCKGNANLTFKEKLEHPAYRGNYKPRQSKAQAEGWVDEQTSKW